LEESFAEKSILIKADEQKENPHLSSGPDNPWIDGRPREKK
jgi:hypothetical protein